MIDHAPPRLLFGSELLLWLVVGFPVAWWMSRTESPTHLWRWVRHFARRRAASVLAVSVFAILASISMAVAKGAPIPRVHDEFSYLLAGDTFAHGRLSNPTPPLAEFFETFHELVRPRYASMFPPAQGAFLAIGQLVTGRPYVGVWLGMAFACGALTWMLQAWAPPRWALAAALIATVRIVYLGAAFPGGDGGYWSSSYWGGAVAMGGGALVFGALRRILSGHGVGSALTMGAGFVVLAFSRPFEGLVVSVPVAAVLARWALGRQGPRFSELIGRTGLPFAFVVGIGAVAMGYYNSAVTGDPLLLPHRAYQLQYYIAPQFLWGSPAPCPPYEHPVLAAYFVDLLRRHEMQHTWPGLLRSYTMRSVFLSEFFIGGLFVVPLLALGPACRDRWTGFAVVTTGLLIVASFQVGYLTLPHYLAPATGLIAVVLLRTVRCLRLWRINRLQLGRAIVRALPAVCVASALVSLLVPATRGWSIERARIDQALHDDHRHHLVVVRYGPGHNPHEEWVYNDADLERAPVIWARDMGRENDGRLLEHFRARTAWLLEPDLEPPRIVPFRDP